MKTVTMLLILLRKHFSLSGIKQEYITICDYYLDTDEESRNGSIGYWSLAKKIYFNRCENHFKIKNLTPKAITKNRK